MKCLCLGFEFLTRIPITIAYSDDKGQINSRRVYINRNSMT